MLMDQRDRFSLGSHANPRVEAKYTIAASRVVYARLDHLAISIKLFYLIEMFVEQQRNSYYKNQLFFSFLQSFNVNISPNRR